MRATVLGIHEILMPRPEVNLGLPIDRVAVYQFMAMVRNREKLPPIEVIRDGAHYRILNGRKRFIAHLMENKTTIEAFLRES